MQATKPSIVPPTAAAAGSAGAGIPASGTGRLAAGTGGLGVRLGRTALLRALGGLEHGEICLLDGTTEQRFGRRSERCALAVTIRVLDPRFYAHAAFGGSVGAGEAYIRGYWSCEDLTALIRIMVVNRRRSARWSAAGRG